MEFKKFFKKFKSKQEKKIGKGLFWKPVEDFGFKSLSTLFALLAMCLIIYAGWALTYARRLTRIRIFTIVYVYCVVLRVPNISIKIGLMRTEFFLTSGQLTKESH